MGKRKDEYVWNHMEKLADGVKCNYCSTLFKGRPSVSRLKSHLLGTPNQGIIDCKAVPSEVKRELAEIDKSRKSDAAGSLCFDLQSDGGTGGSGGMGEGGGEEIRMEHREPITEGTNSADLPQAREEDHPESLQPEGMDISGTIGFGISEMDDFLIQDEVGTFPDQSQARGEDHPEPLQPEGSGMIGLGRSAMDNVFIQDEVETLKRKLGMLTSRGDDVQSELRMIEESSSKKRKCAVAKWLGNVDSVANKFQRLKGEMRGSRFGWNVGWKSRVGNLIEQIDELSGQTFGGELVQESSESETVPFVVSELVGCSFESNKTKIWEWLMSDEVWSVGIHGMGGVGKTTLTMHIYNRLLKERPSNLGNIYWVTVSQDFSIYKLQDQVANKIGCDLGNESDVKMRAARLSEAFKKKRQKSVLILDDLWKEFDPKEIGIPINSSIQAEEKACKLILTTRSSTICWRMYCQQKMMLEPLPKEESWRLFTDTLGSYSILTSEVQQTAKLVADECAGLPLGLVTLAGSMRGVDDIREWRSVLEQLKDSRIAPPEMEDKVFTVLNLSFDRLRDPELQECLLYCALFPEDSYIPRQELIQYLVNDEIMKGPTSRKAQVERVHALLNKLENVGLLQGVKNIFSQSYGWSERVKMHDLIRDMAIRKSPKAMVEAGKQLRELPPGSRWPTDLTRASFIGNNIEAVPGAYSPSCPALSSLLLSNNIGLRDIGNGFFTHMLGLRILDLSETAIYVLPDSVSNLANLTLLLLRSCENLCDIPSLATLRKLQELDLSGCVKLEQVPAGLEYLSNLWYLDLTGTGIKVLPDALLSHNLSNLEHLGLPYDSPLNERLACWGKLDYLSCRVQSPRYFIGMVTDDVQRLCPSGYFIVVGEDKLRSDCPVNCKKRVMYYGCDIGEGGELFAAPYSGFDVALIQYCHSLTSLDKFHCADDGGVGSGREVDLDGCDSLECIISPSYIPVLSNIVNHVVKLTLVSSSNLRFLIHITQPLLSHDVFSCLRVLRIESCPRIQSLFTFDLLTNLRNLEKIHVVDCDGIEEIIADRGIEGALLLGEASSSSSDADNESAEFISLPKLRVFELVDLPQLKSICSRKVTCASLEKIVFLVCPRLERIPFSLVQLDNGGRPSALPSLKEIEILQEEQDWWNSVELDYKDVLEPLIQSFW